MAEKTQEVQLIKDIFLVRMIYKKLTRLQAVRTFLFGQFCEYSKQKLPTLARRKFLRLKSEDVPALSWTVRPLNLFSAKVEKGAAYSCFKASTR